MANYNEHRLFVIEQEEGIAVVDCNGCEFFLWQDGAKFPECRRSWEECPRDID